MLELRELTLDERGMAHLRYAVRHNVGRLRTTLEQNLDLKLDPRTGKVTGELHLTELEATSLDAAREKMAFWCERMAAALRGAHRREGDLPLYEKRPFELSEQPLWLQQDFATLVQSRLAAQTDEDHQAIERWLDGHPMVLVYGLLDAADAEVIRTQEKTDVDLR